MSTPDLSRDERTFHQVLELLKGPTDERRFVGMLLAASTMPKDDTHKLQQVHDAAGSAFFDRLLIPLKSQQVTQTEGADQLKRCAICGLGIALLSALCHAPGIASSAEMTARLPLLIKVIGSQGVTSLLLHSNDASKETDKVNEDAMRDSLVCLTLVAASSSSGRQAILDSSGLSALLTACSRETSYQMWGVRLVLSLFDTASGRSKLLKDHELEISRLIPVLAGLLGSKAASAQRASSDSLAAKDAASQQLEVLRALLLLLQMPQGQGEDALREAAEGGRAPWMQAARAGLFTLLQAKVDPALRQAVLCLTAQFCHLASPQWLQESPAFFMIVVALAKVEIILLLRDALDPEAVIPSSWQSNGKTHTSEDQPSGSAAEEGGTGSLSADSDAALEAGSTPLEDHIAQDSPLQRMSRDTRRIDSMREGSIRNAGGDGERAVDRAVRNLPSILELFEGCIDSLAEGVGVGAGQNGEAATALPEEVASKAMLSIAETAEALLQFLEEMKQEDRDDLISLAAARALGRFAAEMPHLEEERVQKLLSWLIQLQDGTAVAYLLPFLTLVTGPDMPEKTRRNWINCARMAQVLQLLGGKFMDLASRDVAADNLYESCVVFAQVADTSDEDEACLLSSNSEWGEAVVSSAVCLCTWAQKKIGAKQHARSSSTTGPVLEPMLLCYIGHITAVGLEMASLQADKKFEAQSLLSETLLTALDIGDLLLNMMPSKTLDSKKVGTQSYEDFLRDAGKGLEDSEETNETAEEVEHTIQATSVIFERLTHVYPKLAKHAETSNWYQQKPSRLV